MSLELPSAWSLDDFQWVMGLYRGHSFLFFTLSVSNLASSPLISLWYLICFCHFTLCSWVLVCVCVCVRVISDFTYYVCIYIMIIYKLYFFFFQEFFTLMLADIFLWSWSDSKSPQMSRTLLSILADLKSAVVWMVSGDCTECTNHNWYHLQFHVS